LLIASQGVILLGLLIPGLFSAFMQDLQGVPIGPWLRIMISGGRRFWL
jgi:hypothetical protein